MQPFYRSRQNPACKLRRRFPDAVPFSTNEAYDSRASDQWGAVVWYDLSRSFYCRPSKVKQGPCKARPALPESGWGALGFHAVPRPTAG
jgi:hypothetical protein